MIEDEEAGKERKQEGAKVGLKAGVRVLTKVTMEEYLEARENYQGWCTTCQEFTRDETEPDAEGYECPKCEQNTVVGAEDALMMELFTVEGDMP